MNGVEHIICIIQTIAERTTENNCSYTTLNLRAIVHALGRAEAIIEGEIDWRDDMADQMGVRQ
jgi:hypothetical protein